MTGATLILELSVLWEYDGPDGYVWRANFEGRRGTGRADTDADACRDGIAWLSVASGGVRLRPAAPAAAPSNTEPAP